MRTFRTPSPARVTAAGEVRRHVLEKCELDREVGTPRPKPLAQLLERLRPPAVAGAVGEQGPIPRVSHGPIIAAHPADDRSDGLAASA